MQQREYVQTTITLLTAARTSPEVLDELLNDVDLRDYMKTMFAEMATAIPQMASGEFDLDHATELMKSGKIDDVIADMALQLASDDTTY